MATKSMQPTAGQLNAVQVTINNTLADPEIQTLVAQYGYPAAKLNEGKALYQATVEAVNAHTALAGTHRVATAHLRAAEEEARDAHQALAQVGIESPRNLEFCALDFERMSLVEGLAATSFDHHAPTSFSWLGVTMYLTRGAIESTLRFGMNPNRHGWAAVGDKAR